MKEDTIQRSVIQHLDARAFPEAIYWHTPNGGYRNAIEAKRFKSLGVTPGMPDLFILKGGRLYGLELKAEKGRPTAAQKAMHQALEAAGATVAIATGLDPAIQQLEQWGILK